MCKDRCQTRHIVIRLCRKPKTYKAFQGQIAVGTNREIGIDAPPSLAGNVDVLDVKTIDAFPYRDTFEEFLLRPCAARPVLCRVRKHVFGGRSEYAEPCHFNSPLSRMPSMFSRVHAAVSASSRLGSLAVELNNTLSNLTTSPYPQGP